MSFLVLPGTLIVFVATWLYMEATPPKAPNEHGSVLNQPTSSPWYGERLAFNVFKVGALHFPLMSCSIELTFASQRVSSTISISLWTCVTVIITTTLLLSGAHLSVDFSPSSRSNHDDLSQLSLNSTIRSPFQDTLAFIRLNTHNLAVRIPHLRSYKPFFQELHISIPSAIESYNNVNLTYDNLDGIEFPYESLADTMQIILDAPPETSASRMKGIMFFHFDAWIDPLGFVDENFENIWFPDSPDPRFVCMNTTDAYPGWWGWSTGWQQRILDSAQTIREHELEYVVDPNEWCVGYVTLESQCAFDEMYELY